MSLESLCAYYQLKLQEGCNDTEPIMCYLEHIITKKAVAQYCPEANEWPNRSTTVRFHEDSPSESASSCQSTSSLTHPRGRAT